MKRCTRFYTRWIERRIEARARQAAHFDRAWSLKWACILEIASMLPAYLALWGLLAVFTVIFVPDRDLPTVVGSMIRVHVEMLQRDSFILYVYIIAVTLQCLLWYHVVEREKRRVFLRLGHCTHCGYPLTDPEQPVCTECGKAVERLEAPQHEEMS